MAKRDFLVEIGTEELPPRSLFAMTEAFADGLQRELDNAGLRHGRARWFATPRRMAVLIEGVAEHQPNQEIKRLGPAIAQAFDAN